MACKRRFVTGMEKLSRGCRELEPLEIGQVVLVQNQTGPRAKRWDQLGTVVEKVNQSSYLIKMDGSGRVSKRNRQYLKRISQVNDSSDDAFKLIEKQNSPQTRRSERLKLNRLSLIQSVNAFIINPSSKISVIGI